MKVEPEDLPLIINQMATIQRAEQEYAAAHNRLIATRGHLQAFVEKHYGINIMGGEWQLDPSTGELQAGAEHDTA